MILGIDIGTSYSSAAMMQNEKAVPVSVGDGHQFSIPSAVFVEEDGELLIGRGANSRRMKNPSCYKANFKRDLGTQQPYLLGSQEFLPEQLYMSFFRYFAQKAKEQAGQEIEKTYITHPAGYGSNKKQLLQQAADYAGLSQTELIDEPTAAALHYIFLGEVTIGERLLVYDMGGGTFDLSLLEVTQQGIRAMTAALGLLNCGGVVFDKYIYQDIVKEFSRENDMTKALESIKFRSILNDVALKVKHLLSENKEALDGIPFGFGEVLDYTLTREQFNEMIQKDVLESCALVEKIAKNAGISPQDIDKVLCVGGSTRIPYVRESLQKTVGSPVLYNTNPELAVCLGAVRKGAFDEQHRMSSIHTGKEEIPVQREKIGEEQDLKRKKPCGEGEEDKWKEITKEVKRKAYPQKLLSKENVRNLFTEQRYVAIPEGYTDIGEGAFNNYGEAGFFRRALLGEKPNTTLESISFPEGLRVIGKQAFARCTALKALELPYTVEDIVDGAFEECKALSSVLLLDGDKVRIGDGAFRGCQNMVSAKFLSEEIWFGKAAFCGCGSLTSITLSAGMTAIEEETFKECALLTSIDIPSEVTEIRANAFEGCKSLESVLLPNKVAKIGEGVFKDCTGLITIKMPDSLVSIGKQAFNQCTSLSDIVLPSGLLDLGEDVFSGCKSLETIDIPPQVKKIETYAFGFCNSLKAVSIPSEVTEIGSMAFSYCSNLMSVTIPDSVLEIGHSAFSGCRKLVSIKLPPKLTKVESTLFSGCKSLVSINIPSQVTRIGMQAFQSSGLTSIILPDGVSEIESLAFKDCGTMTYAFISGTVKKVGSSAFENCKLLRKVVLSPGIQEIGTGAFKNCSSLKEVIIRSTVSVISEDAFRGCENLTSVNIMEGVSQLDAFAFGACFNLTSVSIPASVTKIDSFAFSNSKKKLTISCKDGSYAHTYAIKYKIKFICPDIP